jgi:lysophospholipase
MLHFFVLCTLFLAICNGATIRQLPSGYAPRQAQCPSTPLVRPATGLSTSEASFLRSRKARADQGLRAWLKKTNPGFNNTGRLPTLALTTSGGGYRSLLCGAGVIQGYDIRDSNVSTSGLYQAFTYQAGLSGGAWLLSSLAGNNYPTISALRDDLWIEAFRDSLLLPSFLTTAVAYGQVTNDVVAKDRAGFPPTLTDPWGRLLSYQLLFGFNGGVFKTLSGIASGSNFSSFNIPYPIITGVGVKTFEGECIPGPNATTYELTPYEFGSWDQGVSAFTQSNFLGSNLSNGQPIESGRCIVNYDNLGYALGTSSSLFNTACSNVPQPNTTTLNGNLAAIVRAAHQLSTRELYAIYPNPFFNYTRSSLVAAQKELSLVDGGLARQNNPIFPLLQPSREVDVMVVNDNSADTNSFPNGSAILTTYVQSLNAGLAKMPIIPSVETFISQGLNKRPTFFGCNDNSKITIVYVPNVNYTFPSNQPTSKLQYQPDETRGLFPPHTPLWQIANVVVGIIANGIQIATQNDDSEYPTCLGCAIMKKTGRALPAACTPCFTEYCFN